jgi:hypothetical protein
LIKQLFDGVCRDINASTELSQANKEDIKAEGKVLQSKVTQAAQKNEKLDEGFLSRHFRNIARMAPDLFDVVVQHWLIRWQGWESRSRRSPRRRRKRRRTNWRY